MYTSLFEQKSVGIIYHYTRRIWQLIDIFNNGLTGSISRIDSMKSDIGDTIILPKTKEQLYSYSFTRNKNLHKEHGANFGTLRLKLDGNKMSDHFKFIPVAEKQYQKGNDNFEFEERIISTKQRINLKPYLLEIAINKFAKAPSEYVNKYNDMLDYCEKHNIDTNFLN